MRLTHLLHGGWAFASTSTARRCSTRSWPTAAVRCTNSDEGGALAAGAPADSCCSTGGARRRPAAARSRSARPPVRALHRPPHRGSDRRRAHRRARRTRVGIDYPPMQRGTARALPPRHGAERGASRPRCPSWSASCAVISRHSRAAEDHDIHADRQGPPHLRRPRPNDVSGIEARSRRPHRSGRHRRDPRQDRGQRQRQRFHAAASPPSLTLMLERHLGRRATRQDLPGDVRRHRGRDGAALDRVRARRGRRRTGPALAIGRAHTPALPAEQLGRLAQVDQVADGVRAAMRMPASPMRPTCISCRSSARC